MELSPNFKKSL